MLSICSICPKIIPVRLPKDLHMKDVHPSYIHRINLTVQYCRISAMQLPQSMSFPLSHLNLVIPAGFKHRKLLSAEKGKTLNDSQVVK